MTGLIDRMERDGFVCRSPDPTDRRVQIIFLTDNGKKCGAPVMNVVDNVLSDIFSGVSEKDFAQTQALLKQVLANAQEDSK